MGCPIKRFNKSEVERVEDPLQLALKKFYDSGVVPHCKEQNMSLHLCRVGVIKGTRKGDCVALASEYEACVRGRDARNREVMQACGGIIGDFGSLKDRTEQCLRKHNGREDARAICHQLVERFDDCASCLGP